MIPEIKLDLIQTLAVAAVVFYTGVFLKQKVKQWVTSASDAPPGQM